MTAPIQARRKGNPAGITRAEQAYRHILSLITDGGLGEGDRLPGETELATRFGISRPLIRQALSRLQAAGVVDVRWGAGSFVRDGQLRREEWDSASAMQSLNDVRHLFELRAALEGDAAALAAERRTPDSLDAIERAADAMETALRTGAVGHEADMAFHFAVAAASANPMFERMLHALRRSLIFSMGLARSLALTHPTERVRAVQDEHIAIAQAIRDADAPIARTMMQAHLRNSCQRLFLGPGQGNTG